MPAMLAMLAMLPAPQLCSPCPARALTPLRPLCPQSYSVALYLVRQLTSSELLQRLKTIGVKHPELCKALGEHCGAFPALTGLVPALTAELPLLGACRLSGDTHPEPGSLRRSLGDANEAGSQGQGRSRCAHRPERAAGPTGCEHVGLVWSLVETRRGRPQVMDECSRQRLVAAV